MKKSQIKRLIVVIIGLTVLGTLGIAVLWWNHIGMKYICMVKYTIGYDCPGCGGTRMIVSLLQGNIEQAFRYNPFLFLTLIPVTIIGIKQTIKFIISGEFSVWLDKVLITYVILLLLFGIARNIEVFSWLKPTHI